MVCGTTFHPTILVVEDDGLVRIDAADTLREAGFAVIEAEGADEALEVIASRDDIDVLFTDINMPGRLDGVELARLAHRLHPDIRLVLTSGETRPEDAEIPDDGIFIRKPYSPKAMARTVARLLS